MHAVLPSSGFLTGAAVRQADIRMRAAQRNSEFKNEYCIKAKHASSKACSGLMRHVVAYARVSTQVKLDCSMQHANHANKFHAHAAINSHAVCWQKYGFRQVPLKQVVI